MSFFEEVFLLLQDKFGAAPDPSALDHSVLIEASKLHSCVSFLKKEAPVKMEVLLDIVGVDYLGYLHHEGPRFAVIYVFKSLSSPQSRIRLKVCLSEDSPQVPTISDLYSIANWQEREVYDQYGIHFEGHPDLRRLLNHVEFKGHPLRKDYPVHQRQWLSTNDFLLDVLEARLEEKGYKILERSKEVLPNDDEYLTGSIQK